MTICRLFASKTCCCRVFVAVRLPFLAKCPIANTVIKQQINMLHDAPSVSQPHSQSFYWGALMVALRRARPVERDMGCLDCTNLQMLSNKNRYVAINNCHCNKWRIERHAWIQPEFMTWTPYLNSIIVKWQVLYHGVPGSSPGESLEPLYVPAIDMCARKGYTVVCCSNIFKHFGEMDTFIMFCHLTPSVENDAE